MKMKNKDSLELFFGDIRMHVKSAENYIQVNQLCMHIQTVKNVKISSYNWSEKEGLIISLSLKDSVPLGNVLDQIPMVEKAYKNRSKEITVELDNSYWETYAPVLKLNKEAITV